MDRGHEVIYTFVLGVPVCTTQGSYYARGQGKLLP
jgi:hypothetical protein